MEAQGTTEYIFCLERSEKAEIFYTKDLNLCSDKEVLEAKLLMDDGFLKNQIKKEDEGYVHDKREAYIPTEYSEWD